MVIEISSELSAFFVNDRHQNIGNFDFLFYLTTLHRLLRERGQEHMEIITGRERKLLQIHNLIANYLATFL